MGVARDEKEWIVIVKDGQTCIILGSSMFHCFYLPIQSLPSKC